MYPYRAFVMSLQHSGCSSARRLAKIRIALKFSTEKRWEWTSRNQNLKLQLSDKDPFEGKWSKVEENIWLSRPFYNSQR
jgi:hypothetical protein